MTVGARFENPQPRPAHVSRNLLLLPQVSMLHQRRLPPASPQRAGTQPFARQGEGFDQKQGEEFCDGDLEPPALAGPK